MQISDIYDSEAITRALPKGASALCIKETDSTNNIARGLALKGAKSGTVVLADKQSAGRGRRGKSFFSADGGIYMSVIVDECEGVPYTVCAAAAVCKALRAFCVDAKIKWVNDIFVDGKKVCGILCERINKAPENASIVIGIGINHSVKDFPDEIKETAASLPDGVPDIQSVVLGVLKELFAALCDVGASTEYYESQMLLNGKRVLFELNGKELRGTVRGLGNAQALLVMCDDGIEYELTSGMVTLEN